MKVLVACEFSGIVRDAFHARGHDATSCDFEPSETPGQHYRGDVRDIIGNGWDLMIACPPCDHLAISGRAHFHKKQKEQAEALEFVRYLMAAPIPRICIENPIGVISTRIRKPDQYVQPWQFGKMENKKTGLWLIKLPKLVPTKIVPALFNWTQMHGQSRDRKKNRSRFFHGIANAMADQWGILNVIA